MSPANRSTVGVPPEVAMKGSVLVDRTQTKLCKCRNLVDFGTLDPSGLGSRSQFACASIWGLVQFEWNKPAVGNPPARRVVEVARNPPKRRKELQEERRRRLAVNILSTSEESTVSNPQK
ncbi:hypothetical protein FQN51_002480 [Onygenales sp. PD_10]|nr:hypothetical protein FQN51_002480 [Onygenales sp. PD_10]